MANVRIGNRVFNGIDGVLLDSVEHNSKSTLFSLMDWNENEEGKANYIKNRPFWNARKEIVWDGVENTNTISLSQTFATQFPQISSVTYLPHTFNNFVPELMVGGTVELNINGTTENYTIIQYCNTITQYQHACTEYAGTKSIILVNGGAFNFPSVSHIACLPISGTTPAMVFCIAPANFLALGAPEGIYAFKFTNSATSTTHYLTKLIFNDIIFNEEYQNFFDYLRNPIYILPLKDKTQVLNQDLSVYKPGDLILLTLNDPAVFMVPEE